MFTDGGVKSSSALSPASRVAPTYRQVRLRSSLLELRASGAFYSPSVTPARMIHSSSSPCYASKSSPPLRQAACGGGEDFFSPSIESLHIGLHMCSPGLGSPRYASKSSLAYRLLCKTSGLSASGYPWAVVTGGGTLHLPPRINRLLLKCVAQGVRRSEAFFRAHSARLRALLRTCSTTRNAGMANVRAHAMCDLAVMRARSLSFVNNCQCKREE
jgi:hypothetical protein